MERAKMVPASNVHRAPLSERQPRGKPSCSHPKASQQQKQATTTQIPHHESVYPDGNLSVIARTNTQSPRIANHKAIAIAQDVDEVNKRDSQVSNASTASTAKAKRKSHIGPWRLGRTLGKGATGRVRLAKHEITGQTAAIKIVSKKSAAMVQSASMAQMDNDTSLSSNIMGNRTMPFGIEREIVIMKLIDHPNITSLYDIWENRGELYLVLEYVEGGELFEYVMRNGALPENEAVRLFRQLIAGLAYCHRFNICHRDLKPENLLLDSSHNLKIADFGMAALQPIGKNLTTSCGSPHYAAPEIIAAKEYKGNQADVWSVGIILYAMLNGFLPFDGEGVSSTLKLVKKGKYYLSPNLTPEATDMIQRILQLNPNDRISIDEMWGHPLLKKYEEIHGTLSPGGRLAGPPPPLNAADCGSQRLKASEIDRELLRNLQILWHGLAEQEVIRRLTNSEPNHEKLFYQALLRFREEQMENFTGDSMQHSASDYHHMRKQTPRLLKSSTKTALHNRQSSQFSIVSGESIVRDAYYKDPTTAASKTTQGSYDPYRASRKPITNFQKQGTKVLVEGSGNHACAQASPYTNAVNEGRGRKLSSTYEMPIYDSQELRRILEQRRMTHSTLSSHSSMSGSLHRRVIRKSNSYRRSVAFQHRHRKSSRQANMSGPASPERTTRVSASDEHSHKIAKGDSKKIAVVAESDLSLAGPGPHRPQISRRPMETPLKDVTRKASAELGKMCEDAFNRSSVSYASELSQRAAVESPATTVSAPMDISGSKINQRHSSAMTPALRDLMERRKRIIETWGEADPQTLAALVHTLDQRITEEQRAVDTIAERRAASDPTNGRHIKPWPNSSTPSPVQNPKVSRVNESRSVSDPIKQQDHTIRMVSPDPSSPVSRLGTWSSKISPINSLKGGPWYNENNRIRDGNDKYHLNFQSLEPILEDSPRSPTKGSSSDNRKWSWLGKKPTTANEEFPPTPPRKDTPKEKNQRSISGLSSASSQNKKKDNGLEESEARKRHWFQKVFSRRKKESAAAAQNDHLVVQDDLDDNDSVADAITPIPIRLRSRGRNLEPTTEGVASLNAPRSDAGQNWLAKFLHLKPATSVLILNVHKANARREIVKILREWQKFGIRDVQVEKRPGGDVIRARVDAANYLHIRPVQFFANVYTILEKGKTAQLAIVKFTQEKGAASSFHRVVDTIESVLKENELILGDMAKRKKILKSMQQAGL